MPRRSLVYQLTLDLENQFKEIIEADGAYLPDRFKYFTAIKDPHFPEIVCWSERTAESFNETVNHLFRKIDTFIDGCLNGVRREDCVLIWRIRPEICEKHYDRIVCKPPEYSGYARLAVVPLV